MNRGVKNPNKDISQGTEETKLTIESRLINKTESAERSA